MRKILLVVPYRARDLGGTALVGYHLQERYGCEVVYSNGYGIEEKLLRHAPDVLVLDHLAWEFKVEQARLARSLGIRVAVLPTEGLFHRREDAVRVAGARFDAGEVVDLYLAWGAFHRRFLVDELDEDRVCTVGCPRFDFYADPLLRLAGTRASFLDRQGIRRPDAKVIVWATNTGYVARNREKMVQRWMTRAQMPLEQIEQILDDQQTQFHEHSNVVRALARRHPEWHLLIKVHPAEWINPYVEMAESTPNIHLAFDAPIRDFLYHGDVLLQRNCTTAMEGWMLGKPVLQLEIGTYHRDSDVRYTEGSDVVRTVEDAEAAIANYLDGGVVPPQLKAARDGFLEDYFFRIDGRAAERVAERLFGLVSAPHYSDRDHRLTVSATREAYRRWRRARDARPANRIKKLLGVDQDTSLRFWKKFFRREAGPGRGHTAEPEITPEMVEAWYDQFRHVLPADGARLAAPHGSG